MGNGTCGVDRLMQLKVGELDCPICRSLLEAIQQHTDTHGGQKFELGTFQEIRKSQCISHEVVSAYSRRVERDITLDVAKEPKVIAHCKHSLASFEVVLMVREYEPECADLNFLRAQFIALEHPCEKQRHPANAKRIDPAWLDFSLLREWKTACLHHDTCTSADVSCGKTPNRYPLLVRPSLLIDNQDMCLVEANSQDSYAALSYVWGQTKTLQTNWKNLEMLKAKHSLSTAIKNSEISNTIVHAIEMSRLLDERYLWVDALCIIQDDDARKTHEISHMPDIYANSSVAIIAAQGNDANHGIRGVSVPRASEQIIYELFGLAQVVEFSQPELYDSTWANRGWTYQEALFAPRRLIFTDHRVQWICNTAIWQEDVQISYDWGAEALFYPYSVYPDSRKDMISLAWPDLYSYAVIVNGYSKRDFTFAKDTLYAFAGITSILGRSFNGGFLFGLPEMFFDIGLLWNPSGDIERRVPVEGTLSRDWKPPSWSWMGWKGGLRLENWGYGADYMKSRGSLIRTVPIIQWYAGNTKTDKHNFRKIAVTGRRYMQAMADDKSHFPPGWVRHTYNHDNDPDQFSYPEGKDRQYTFTHEDAPDTEFWYPIFLPQDDDDTESDFESKMARYLHFRTQRARLFCCRDQHWGNESIASLFDEHGSWVGWLGLHNRAAARTFPWRSDPIDQRKKVELIAISAGSYLEETGDYYAHSVLRELGHPERPVYGDQYEFYNVLWIEWEDGVAYRKGLGRVEKRAWEAAKREEIDVLLG